MGPQRSTADSNENLRTVESLKRNEITYTVQVAKYPAYPHQTVEHLEVAHGASNFVHTLQEFLSQHIPENLIHPSRQDRFDIYKQVVITAPTLPPVGEKLRQWRLRATPAGTSAPNGRKTVAPAHFDMALVKTHEGGNDEPGQTLLQGQISVLQWILIALRLIDVLYNRFMRCSSTSNIYPSAAIWAVSGSSSLCRMVHSSAGVGPCGWHVSSLPLNVPAPSKFQHHPCQRYRPAVPSGAQDGSRGRLLMDAGFSL